MKKFSEENMKIGLECYEPESRVFPELADAWKEPRLTQRDVLLILKWKLDRIKKSYCKIVNEENMRIINRAVEKAGKADDRNRIEALEDLKGIQGIKLAAAAAILTVCYPEVFSMIDQRVLELLKLSPSCSPKEKYNTDEWSAEAYIEEYLPAVREYAKHWGCTLRNADRALWGLSVNKQIENCIAESKQT